MKKTIAIWVHETVISCLCSLTKLGLSYSSKGVQGFCLSLCYNTYLNMRKSVTQQMNSDPVTIVVVIAETDHCPLAVPYTLTNVDTKPIVV